MWIPLALVLVAAAHSPSTQEPLPQSAPVAETVEKLEAWPVLDAPARRKIDGILDRLAGATTPTMADDAAREVAELGAAAVPRLMDKLASTRAPAGRGRIEQALTELVHAPHARLLAVYFEHDHTAVRRFALGRAGALGVRELGPAAEAALERARVALAKPTAKGARAEEALFAANAELQAAALATAGSGSIAGMDVLHALAQSDWKSQSTALRAALAGARGQAATRVLVPLVRTTDGLARVAALRLLAAAGEGPDATDVAHAMLDIDETPVRVAAINALRALVDGEEPIDNLSVFESIELAKRWRERL